MYIYIYINLYKNRFIKRGSHFCLETYRLQMTSVELMTNQAELRLCEPNGMLHACSNPSAHCSGGEKSETSEDSLAFSISAWNGEYLQVYTLSSSSSS